MNPPTYHLLKAAQSLFARPVGELDPDQHKRAAEVGQRAARIEEAVLKSPAARGVVLADHDFQAAWAEVRGRFEDDEAFEASLAAHGLDPDTFAQALRRDRLVEQVLARVGAQAGPVATTDVEIFYYSHIDRFRQPELREVRHILVTINPELAENRRERAHARLAAVREHLLKTPAGFAEAASRHSECPTALNGGLIGKVPAGKLYPALDTALFALAPGALSAIVESELGFHLLRCETVEPGRTLPFEEVAASLQARLDEARAQRHVKAWLAALLRPGG